VVDRGGRIANGFVIAIKKNGELIVRGCGVRVGVEGLFKSPNGAVVVHGIYPAFSEDKMGFFFVIDPAGIHLGATAHGHQQCGGEQEGVPFAKKRHGLKLDEWHDACNVAMRKIHGFTWFDWLGLVLRIRGKRGCGRMTNDEWDGGKLEVARCWLQVAGWPNVGRA